MRSFHVVAVQKRVEVCLHVLNIRIQDGPEDCTRDGAVPAFDLPLCLRVKGAAMNQPDTELHQLDIKGRERETGMTPWWSIIREDRPRETVSLETLKQMSPHRFPRFIGTGGQGQAKAGMVIQNGEWMYTALLHPLVSQKVHLPEIIRRMVLEAMASTGRPIWRWMDESMAMQD